jgi:hypothetical protein
MAKAAAEELIWDITVAMEAVLVSNLAADCETLAGFMLRAGAVTTARDESRRFVPGTLA